MDAYFTEMAFEKELKERSNGACELCSAEQNLEVYEIPPSSNGSFAKSIYACSTCIEQMNDPKKMDANHWRCLNDSMWSEVPGVQVMAWRMLNRLRGEGWPTNLLDILYLDDETLKWAKATGEGDENDSPQHRDSNGDILQSGDNVVLIKDLNVKGANFTAKRGTAVRRISLVKDNPEQIEGKVNGQQIVILTQYVKKSS